MYCCGTNPDNRSQSQYQVHLGRREAVTIFIYRLLWAIDITTTGPVLYSMVLVHVLDLHDCLRILYMYLTYMTV